MPIEPLRRIVLCTQPKSVRHQHKKILNPKQLKNESNLAVNVSKQSTQKIINSRHRITVNINTREIFVISPDEIDGILSQHKLLGTKNSTGAKVRSLTIPEIRATGQIQNLVFSKIQEQNPGVEFPQQTAQAKPYFALSRMYLNPSTILQNKLLGL
ncbi:MAG: hypothetical protein QNJ31_02635 [Candidatus Caenarcaniphilales bacterium]|nr:hypothetical protein [Candidatus Caenarcaniphilales bacterium]